jgi:serine protease 12 (motopsin)
LNIDEIYLHEEFNKNMRLNNDIALVKVKGLGIQLGPHVMPACLPHHGVQYIPGLNCTISGWGSVKAAGSGEHSECFVVSLRNETRLLFRIFFDLTSYA